MINIGLFVEDIAHEKFIKRCIKRFSDKYGIKYVISLRTVVGGPGAAIKELDKYVRDIKSFRTQTFDLIIIVKDSNCHKWQDVKKRIARKFTNLNTIYAIPDPHIEKWYLMDPAAIKKIIGHGYTTPLRKCDRDFYKQELLKAIQQAVTNPPLGGIEYADEIVDNMDLDNTDWPDSSFARFIKDINRVFKRFQNIGSANSN